jgi:hypothetical protein
MSADQRDNFRLFALGESRQDLIDRKTAQAYMRPSNFFPGGSGPEGGGAFQECCELAAVNPGQPW